MSGGRDADVLIVGAGPAGGVLALRLVRAGFDVVCLEQGASHDPTDFPAARPELEVLARSAWSPDPNVRAGEADYPIDDRDSDVTPLMFNGVGGSTLLYAAEWCRMRPSDFRVRTLDGPRSLPLPERDPDADLKPLLARVRARGPRYRAIPPS